MRLTAQMPTLVVPLFAYTRDSRNQGALALQVRDNGISELGAVTHPGTANTPKGPMMVMIRRSLVIDQTLWTVSDGGLQAHDLRTLAAGDWLAF